MKKSVLAVLAALSWPRAAVARKKAEQPQAAARLLPMPRQPLPIL